MRTSLNVKDPEAQRLAQAIAEATGETLTRAVTERLRERLDRLQKRRSKAGVEEILAIGDRAAVYVHSPYLEHGALL